MSRNRCEFRTNIFETFLLACQLVYAVNWILIELYADLQDSNKIFFFLSFLRVLQHLRSEKVVIESRMNSSLCLNFNRILANFLLSSAYRRILSFCNLMDSIIEHKPYHEKPFIPHSQILHNLFFFLNGFSILTEDERWSCSNFIIFHPFKKF